MTAESGAGQPGETSDRNVYQVSELVGLLRDLLGQSLPRIWVEGEISNFSKPASGHWYFTLKDARAQLRCAMFRNANFRARVRPQNGDAVMVAGRVDLYAARGELQMICEHLEPAGQGALLREFEALKQRLSAEGLFDPAHKRRPPSMPRNIGLITSATGAAAQDVLTALRRRFALAQVSFLPVPVQGEAAAPAIVKALQTLPDQAPV
ncbi:MAG: exodeoxyribonuclease VII large subunit, partial [Panacagrimonas sp.]